MAEASRQPEREQIFEELLRDHCGHIRQLIRRIVRPNEVKDVEQEVFLALWGCIPNVPEDAPARRGWIRELVRRVSFGWLRKEFKGLGGSPEALGCGAARPLWLGLDEAGTEAEAMLAESSRHLSQESTLISQEQERWRRAVFKRALESLTPELKAAYVEVKLNGLGSVEAASKLRIGRNTLLDRIRDASDGIARCLDVAAVDACVSDSTGRRISARVRLEGLDGARTICEADANRRDPVRFEGLQPGEYAISADAAGHHAFQKRVSLRAGLTVLHLILQLEALETPRG